MPTIEETLEVNVAVRTAYDQWTQFEEFPRFMEGVKEVRKVDDTHLHWVAEVAGREAEWDAEITEQERDRRIAWRSTEGSRNDGSVEFESTSDETTRISVAIDHEPEDLGERAADAMGLVQRRVRRDMERFKDLVESRSALGADQQGEARESDADANAGPHDRSDDSDAPLGPEEYPATTRLPSLSRLRGMTVRNAEDEKVGKVREVYLDATADHVRYLGVSTGWLARGTHVVPVDEVTYVDDGAETYVVVPYSAEHLKSAPSLDDDDELSPEREREIYDHYERVGYWDAARDAVRARQTPPAPTPQIAEAQMADAIARGDDPTGVRVTRWGR